MVVDHERFKDSCVQKHDTCRLRGPCLLVKGGVAYDCSNNLYVILKGDLTGVYNRDEMKIV